MDPVQNSNFFRNMRVEVDFPVTQVKGRVQCLKGVITTPFAGLKQEAKNIKEFAMGVFTFPMFLLRREGRNPFYNRTVKSIPKFFIETPFKTIARTVQYLVGFIFHPAIALKNAGPAVNPNEVQEEQNVAPAVNPNEVEEEQNVAPAVNPNEVEEEGDQNAESAVNPNEVEEEGVLAHDENVQPIEEIDIREDHSLVVGNVRRFNLPQLPMFGPERVFESFFSVSNVSNQQEWSRNVNWLNDDHFVFPDSNEYLPQLGWEREVDDHSDVIAFPKNDLSEKSGIWKARVIKGFVVGGVVVVGGALIKFCRDNLTPSQPTIR